MFIVTVFLTVGFAVMDDHVTHIQQLLSSLINHVTPEDAQDITIVISVSGHEMDTVEYLLKDQFGSHVDSGLVHLISPTEEYTRAFSKRLSLGNSHVKDYSKSFAEKMSALNENIGFLLYYSTQLSEYTLHLTDENKVTGRFLPGIKNNIEKHSNVSYFGLKFSQMWLMHTSVLDSLNEFYTMFGYHSTPALMNDYRNIKISHNTLVNTDTDFFPFKPSMDCKRPSASLETSLIATSIEHSIKNIYKTDSNGMFWTLTPRENDYVQITFDNSIKLSRVYIATGTPFFMDVPKKAVLKACRMRDDGKSCDTTNCIEITTLGDPVQDIKGLEYILDFEVKCLRLEFTVTGKMWLIIRDIAVWEAQ